MSEPNYFSDEKNLQYVIKITYLFALIGTFANIMFNLINQNAATAAEVSLGIAGAGVMFAVIFTMMFLNITEGGFSTSGSVDIKKIIPFIIKLTPTVTTFIIITLYFILNSVYQERIDGKNIASEYTTYSTLSAILVFIQTALVGAGLWNIIQPPKNAESQYAKINKLLLVLILFVCNLYLVGISNVILKYFSTDG
jgi:cytochrome bd-type quinol oxidase subunit 2